MVQMKRIRRSASCKRKLDLYPTWFRWNIRAMILYDRACYIYIPHGSDETRDGIEMLDKLVKFISHMVQMKQRTGKKFRGMVRYLYPTWFRWNFTTRKGYKIPFWIYIHMVQMKLPVPYWAWACLKRSIYIPHGSDETRNAL